MKILIVEDDREQMRLLEQLLASLGFQAVLKASNGQEGIRLAEKHQPDLCIADIMMPGMTGGQMREILKENPATRDIPVIFVSGIISKTEVKKIGDRLAGGCIVVAKPFSRNDISQAIKLALTKGSKIQNF